MYAAVLKVGTTTEINGIVRLVAIEVAERRSTCIRRRYYD